MKDKKILICIIVILIGIVGIILVKTNIFEDDKEEIIDDKPIENKGVNYNSLLIKEVNKNNKSNYLISPYSIEIALNLLKESTNNKTRDEITNLIPDRTIEIINSDKVKVSNAAFIKNQFKDLVLSTFTKNLKDKYKADVIYDDFLTSDPINDWVNEKTNKMIPKLIDQIDPNFIFGVTNAVALDLEFKNQFECINTYKTRFTKIDGLHMDVYMMNKQYSNSDATYVKKDDYEAISIPYKTDDENHYSFEFVGIKVDDIDKFINELDDNKLKNIMNDGIVASDDNNVSIRIPKFSYNYELQTDKFSEVLKNLGIKELFSEKPDFTNFISQENMDKNKFTIELSEAIHKTYIDFNEKGTKAAAVTGFLANYKSSINPNQKVYSIIFDKPFIYMIREKNTNDILFFGTVYEPTLYNGNTCQMTY